MRSKTSIQMTFYNELIQQPQMVPLNHIRVAEHQLFESPVEDKSSVKRVVLFSDNPLEDQAFASQQKLELKIW